MPSPRSVSFGFEGGIDFRRSPYDKPHVRDLSNAWFDPDDHGALSSMPGFSSVTGSAPSGLLNVHSLGLGEEVPGATPPPQIFIGGDHSTEQKVYYWSSGGGWVAKKTGLTIGARFDSTQIRNFALFVNGSDPPWQIDLATGTASDVGLSRPDVTNASTSLSPGGGYTDQLAAKGENNVKGVVSYKLAEISGGVEGACSEIFGEIDCGEGSRVEIDLTDSDFSGKTYRIYRTLANGSRHFMAFIEAAGGSTTIDNLEDDLLGDLPYLHGDPPPDDLVSIVFGFGRVWGLTEAGYLYWCDAADHNSWYTASDGNWIPVFLNDGDTGRAVRLAPDGLYVWKDHHLYHVYTADLEAIQVTPISLGDVDEEAVGAPSHQAIALTPYGYAFYHEAGVFVLSGLQVIRIGRQIAEGIRGVSVGKVIVGYSSAKDHLWVSVQSPSGPGSSYLFDFSPDRRMWFGIYDFTFEAFAEIDRGVSQPGRTFHALGGFDTSGQQPVALYEMYLTNTDGNGDPIAWSAALSPFFGSDPTTEKMFLATHLAFGVQSSGSFDVSAVIDTVSAASIDDTVSLVASGRSRNIATLNYDQRGRELEITLSGSAAAPQVKIFGVNHTWHEYPAISE